MLYSSLLGMRRIYLVWEGCLPWEWFWVFCSCGGLLQWAHVCLNYLCGELLLLNLQCKIPMVVIRIWQTKMMLKHFPILTVLWKHQLLLFIYFFSFFLLPPPRMESLLFLPWRSQIQTHAPRYLLNVLTLVGWTVRTARLMRRRGSGSALIHPANAPGSLGNPSLPPPIITPPCKCYLLIFSTNPGLISPCFGSRTWCCEYPMDIPLN